MDMKITHRQETERLAHHEQQVQDAATEKRREELKADAKKEEKKSPDVIVQGALANRVNAPEKTEAVPEKAPVKDVDEAQALSARLQNQIKQQPSVAVYAQANLGTHAVEHARR